jgi:hypothetical protein
MSYATITASSKDQALIDRIVAAVEQESWNNPAMAGTDFGADVQQASYNANRMVWPVVIASDIEAAYASALAAGNPNPGGDEAVITDGQILANVQAKWPTDEAPA